MYKLKSSIFTKLFTSSGNHSGRTRSEVATTADEEPNYP
jgi:hypothetical protein